MTFAIAAAGTGGHVYPGLAVGEALLEMGAARDDILFVGGERLEAAVYPQAGFPFLSLELRGLERRLALSNLGIPGVVLRAERRTRLELRRRGVDVVLAMGGYVTVPVGLAARRAGASLAVAEQNAEAGLANRLMSRLARRVFGSFPSTGGLPRAEWMGNPIRRALADFDRDRLRPPARAEWGLEEAAPVVGVFGGSLGAGAINQAVIAMLESWGGPRIQVLHLAGHGYDEASARARVSPHNWVVLDFCEHMDRFYAACDIVISRAGGSVAELTATATPAVLVPGGFGSGGHQEANAAVLEAAGCAVVVSEAELERLEEEVTALVANPARRREMAAAASRLARPHAARDIATALREMSG
ncbi:MAG: UDP-N-acetylglucosamine--N-acetylmuramyl-(pentapeptide) pyrophosphoryl-undecaprenol N-acetylglucosamine transferase [Actinomycetota bacterium]